MVSTAGGSSGNFVSGDQRLNFVISATNAAAPGIMAVQAGFANLTAVAMRTMDHLNSAMGAVSATALAFGLVSTLVAGYATDAAADYEQSMQMVKAVSKGSAEDFANLSNKAKEMSMQYGMSANEIAGQLQTLGRAGIGASAQMSVFESAMKMSKLEAMDLETSIEGLVKMVGLFGTSVNDPEFGEKAKEMATDLTHASQIAPTTVEDLMQGLQFVGGVAKVAGATQRETLAALSYMSTLGVTGSMAGTALRGFYTKPTLQQPQVKEAMAEIGISPESLWLPDQSAAKPLWEQVKIINEAMKKAGMSAFEKMGIWSKIGMQKTAQQMMKIDEGEMQAYYEKMDEQFDLDEKVAIAMDSLNEQFSRFKSALEVLAISIGDYFVPILRFLVDGLNGLANGLADNKILAGGLAAVLGFGMVAAMVALSYWAYEIVRFLVKAKTLSGVIAALNGASTQATGAAIANTAAMEAKAGASGFAASVAPVGIGRVAPSVSASLSKSAGLPIITSTGAAVGAQKAIGKIGEESAKSSVKSAAAGGVMAGTFGKVKGAATGAFNSIKSGASAAWAALLGMGPAGWAVVGVLIAIAVAAYAITKWYEAYNKDLEKVNKAYEKQKKESAELFSETTKNIEKLKADYDPTELKIVLNTEKFKKQVEEVRSTLDEKIKKKIEDPLYGAPYTDTSITKASQGPVAAQNYYVLRNYGMTVSEEANQYSVEKQREMWPDLQKYKAFVDDINSAKNLSKEEKEENIILAQHKMEGLYGVKPDELEKYNKVMQLNWQAQEANRMQSKAWNKALIALGNAFYSLFRIISPIINLIHRLFFGTANDAKSASKTQQQASKASKTALSQQETALEKWINQILYASWQIENFAVQMNNFANLMGAYADYIAEIVANPAKFGEDTSNWVKGGLGDMLNLATGGEAAKFGKEKLGWDYTNTDKETLYGKTVGSVKYQTMTDMPTWMAQQRQSLWQYPSFGAGYGTNFLTGDQTGEAGGEGGAGGTGSGKGAGGDGAKSSIKKDGYTIDFVLCSKKTLPPLDPNLFKKSKILDLTQKSFKIDNLNINTTDKPANINAAVRKTIVDISESNRVNPREVTTTEV